MSNEPQHPFSNPMVQAALEQAARMATFEAELTQNREDVRDFRKQLADARREIMDAVGEVRKGVDRTNGSVADVVRWQSLHPQVHDATSNQISRLAGEIEVLKAETAENTGELAALKEQRRDSRGRAEERVKVLAWQWKVLLALGGAAALFLTVAGSLVSLIKALGG